MARLKMKDSGIMYINPNPAYGHVFASHPHPHQLPNGEFVSTYMRGGGLYAPDLNVGLLRSTDNGVTWADEGPLYDKSDDDRPYSYHSGFLSRMSDGTLVTLSFRTDRSDPDQPMFSTSGGLVEVESVLFFSQDDGHTWSSPRSLGLPEGMIATASTPIIELADGSWFVLYDRWHGYDDPGPYRPQMLGFYSRDRGESWGEEVIVADVSAEGKGFWHGKAIRLSDDRLYTMFWTGDMTRPDQGPINLPLHCSIGDPTGRTWTPPESIGIPGQTNWPAELSDGTIGAIYTAREAEQPGFVVVLSEDGGKTWDLDNQVLVWDVSGWTHIGIPIADRYPRSHDTIAFGAPALTTTLDGDLYAAWWCTLNSVTHVRWARLGIV